MATTMTTAFAFDNIDDWYPHLHSALKELLPDNFEEVIRREEPRYVEHARDIAFRLADKDKIVDKGLHWIRATSILAYHGSRLTDADVASIREVGLLPLEASTRRERLARALSTHPKWAHAESKLDAAIQRYGAGALVGQREGQAHLTLSRAGLVSGFNHYITHGAEFDQNVARELLGDDGYALLAIDGKATVLGFTVPGNKALDASHPYFSIDHMRRSGEVPNLLSEFLKAWAFKTARPEFQSNELRVDSGLIFRCPVPAGWLTIVEHFDDVDLC